jgi:cobyric acid synthase
MRPIHEIAHEIDQKWPKKYFGAVPYLQAMFYLEDKTSMYGVESAKSIVVYFLSNASTFKGEDAKRIKKELKQMMGVK